MANHGCINGTLQGTNYSSPVPIIGLYIAAASLLCMLMILYDTIAGFRARQRWLPCKSFSLNSVTLTLLSIAAKLSVDLTTPMPNVWDQVSKLSSTAFICVSMGFLLPSVGITSKTECFTNLVALTIFIVTILVNICIQISTGVIALFIAEHIILLCFMLVLLMMFWFSYWDINDKSRISIDKNKVIFTKGAGGMLERLKKSYLFGYCSNPQFVLCLQWVYKVFGVICPACLFILAYTVIKSLVQKELKFCPGVSDYDWSMTIIVVTQLLAVVVGSFSVCFRWLALSLYASDHPILHLADRDIDKVINNNPTLGFVSKLDHYCKFAQNVYIVAVGYLQFLIGLIPFMTIQSICICIWIYGENIRQWKERKSSEDMERWIQASKRTGSSNQVSSLLSRIHPSQQEQQLHTMEIRDEAYPNRAGVKVSCLSIALLVRTAQVSLPATLSAPLLQAFIEANETMHFIEKTMNPKSIQNDKKLSLAKAVWAGADFSCLLNKIFNNDQHAPQADLDRAVVIITKLKSALPSDVVWDELGIIVDFINRKSYSSIEDLGASIEQPFVDMLHQMLAQLPHAIFKLLSDSRDEEYQGSVTLALKFLCKVEGIEDQIQWSFPEGLGITRLITEERQNEVADTAGRNEDAENEVGDIENGNLVVVSDCAEIPIDDVVILTQGRRTDRVCMSVGSSIVYLGTF